MTMFVKTHVTVNQDEGMVAVGIPDDFVRTNNKEKIEMVLRDSGLDCSKSYIRVPRHMKFHYDYIQDIIDTLDPMKYLGDDEKKAPEPPLPQEPRPESLLIPEPPPAPPETVTADAASDDTVYEGEAVEEIVEDKKPAPTQIVDVLSAIDEIVDVAPTKKKK